MSKTHAANYTQLNLAKDRLGKINETYRNMIKEKENKGGQWPYYLSYAVFSKGYRNKIKLGPLQ